MKIVSRHKIFMVINMILNAVIEKDEFGYFAYISELGIVNYVEFVIFILLKYKAKNRKTIVN